MSSSEAPARDRPACPARRPRPHPVLADLPPPGCLKASDGQRALHSFPLPPANRPNGQWLFWRQLNFFRFMPDHKAFAFTQRVFHLLLTDSDFQHLTAVGYGKLKYSVVL